MKKLARSTYSKIAFFITGIGSLVWFLIRVIPKPSRAAYPCMRAAAPVASAFVLYVMGLFATAAFFKKSKRLFSQSRHLLASVFLLAGIFSAMLTTFTSDKQLYAGTQDFTQPVNDPYGTARGIYPGRVVMIHNPDATNYSCPNSLSNPYWSNSYTTQSVVDNMVSAAIQTLTGTNTDAAAWDAIFKYYNQAHGKGSVGYSSLTNEKIFIKTNSVSGYSWNTSTKEPYVYNAETTPQVVLALLRQLVNNAGVPKNNIYVGDPMRHIYQHCYTMWYPEFSGVHFLDNTVNTDGRELAVKSLTDQVFYSDKGTVLGASVTSDKLYQIFTDTEYLINLPQLKAHARAGISLFAKNHFGSHTRDNANHLHNGLVDPNQTGSVRMADPPLYRTQVDLMAHKLLGGKTLFYLLDALWAGSEAINPPTKWKLPPFNCENSGGDWTSAIIASQDPVAVESVGFDLLRSEYCQDNSPYTYPNMKGVDDYLHQAADPAFRPAGIAYDPENDGTALTTSLGVHEHWNDSINKQYTRNLGTGNGIEFLFTKISVTGPLTVFSTATGTPSASQTYTVSGNCLTANLNITAPNGFEISTDGSTFSPNLTLVPVNWQVPATPIHVRLTGSTVGTYNGNILHTSTGASAMNLAVSGTVTTTAAPVLTVAPNNLGFGNAYINSNSASLSFQLSGFNLTGFPSNITISAPSTDFQVSSNNSTWGSTATVAYASAALNATTVYVRFTPQSPGVKSGNVTFAGGGVSSPPTVALTGTGIAPATQLAFVNFPAAGSINTNFTSFTVEARSSDNSVDILFNGDITLTKASGPGNISGTTTVAAINGVATFSAVRADQAGTYTLYANGGSLTRATSGYIVISSNPAGAYRSRATGNWGKAGTWETYNGTNWVTASSSPSSASGNITVRSGHTVTVSGAASADQCTIDQGGQVTVSSGQTWTIANGDGTDLTVNGTVVNSGTMTMTGTAVFSSGAIYQHSQNGGAIPTATWDAVSNCIITNVTNAVPGGLNPSGGFGNFTWNCTGQTSTLYLASNMTVKGNFTVQSTGVADHQDRSLRMTNGTTGYTINVGGNFNVQSPATFKMNNAAGSCVLNITGSLNIAGQSTGTTGFYLNSSSNSGSSAIVYLTGNLNVASGYLIFSNDGGSTSAILNLAGDFNHTGGYIQNTNTSNGYIGTINFCGTGMQTFNSTGITASHRINFTVNNGAYLQMGSPSTIITGAGTFTLLSGATLGITSTNGITTTTTGASGNIQVTGVRTYSTGANYIYNGTAAQNTGNGLPATVSNLTFDNTGGPVAFNSTRTITINFSVATGSVADLGSITTYTSGTITLGGVLQPGGSYGSTSSAATYKSNTYFLAGRTGIINADCTAGPAGLWKGAISNEWETAGNWCGQSVPTGDVVIPAGADVHVTASLTAPSSCSSLTINGTLTIDAGRALTVSGTLTNNGTLNLLSNSGGQASLRVDSYRGKNANIQLYLSPGYWHYISSPTNPGLSADDLAAGNDLARFDEALPSVNPPTYQRGWVAWDGWSYLTEDYSGGYSGFSALERGRGYDYWNESVHVFNFSGQINTSDPSPSITYSGNETWSGYNLLGNPYSCGINIQTMFNDASWPSTAVKSVYFTMGDLSYVVSNGGLSVPSGASLSIPPMQGFFVRATGTGNIPFPLSARQHSSTSRYKGEQAETIPLVRLSINENSKSGETVVRFNEKATAGLDIEFDAPKFMDSPGTPAIYTTLDGKDFAINGLPFPETSVEIPVTLNLLTGGNHSISAMEILELTNYSVMLKDLSTNSTIDLKSVSEYPFTADAGLLKDRFILAITNMTTGIEDPVNEEDIFSIYHGFGSINILPLSDQWDGRTGSIRVMDLSGKTVISQQDNEFRENTLIRIPFNGTRGIYIVEIKSGVNRFTGKVSVR